ncbi:unnamed protein product [Sphagnum jensenii]|uniref:FAD linked oxidase N-terminal domain-containing protein n=2 Tax=Sphagnum jensenii TaxID=128206 RepID=A0ABP0VIK1_9BRYO
MVRTLGALLLTIHNQARSEDPALLQGAGAGVEDHLLQLDTTPPAAAASSSCMLEKADCKILEFLQHNHGLHLSFLQENTSSAVAVSRDWGLIKHLQPAAVLHPTSVHEIAELIRAVASSSSTNLTIAAKGVGHSIWTIPSMSWSLFCWILLIIMIISLSCLNREVMSRVVVEIAA